MPCSIANCDRPARYRSPDLCTGHYQQARRGIPFRALQPRHMTQPRGACSFPGCARPHEGHGYCPGHRRQVGPKKPLRADGNAIHVVGACATMDLYGRHGAVRASATIDAADVDHVRGRRWGVTVDGYVFSGRSPRVLLHRFLLDAPDTMQVDHIDGNPLNNRRANLRLVTFAEQMQNKKPWGRTGHRNVSWDEHTGLYRVVVTKNGTKYSGGRHKLLDDAIAAARTLRARLFTHHNETRTMRE